jgi:hypothetical protein
MSPSLRFRESPTLKSLHNDKAQAIFHYTDDAHYIMTIVEQRAKSVNDTVEILIFNRTWYHRIRNYLY